MLAVELCGGIGNQLFQLAAADTIATETNRTCAIVTLTSPKTCHSDTDYFGSVLSGWKQYPRLPETPVFVDEQSYAKTDWSTTLPKEGAVCLRGYFQNWRYIPADFVSRLSLPVSAPLHGAFLHIRGGDYVNHWLHDVGLQHKYYTQAIAQFPVGTHFYVFTNDTGYAVRSPFLRTIPHTIVVGDECEALSCMAACTLGGICANSSFSWWGAYLNPTRTIVMPDKWFNDPTIYTDGYYFPGVKKCSV